MDKKKPQHSTSDVVAIVDDLLNKAVQAGASDIHFEPGPNDLAVKFRLDGVLDTIERLPKTLTENIVARLKVLGSLLTYRNDIPQEGRIEVTPERFDKVFDQRLAVFPTINGQRAVVRLFYKQPQLLDLATLGFAQPVLESIKTIAAQNQGVLIVTGPAGSGKSTTLASILRHIISRWPGKSIVTIEDPVEIRIDDVTQVQITPHGQMTFPTALRSLLRQDPEVLMIGEIRDAETAKIAIEAGLTGHLLMSTMHSGNSAAALVRLLEMGAEPYQVTSSVSAVLNQRLVRKLCPACKTKSQSKTTGCDQCFNTGYRGRALICELVELDGQLRKALLAKSDLAALEEILKSRGHKTLLDDGRRLIEAGITDTAEINRVCGTNI
ncbi:MAG: hypothetical protein A2Y07_09370 [Planctomycetes bacterium GWF2_50_10]|nr:MAG: hypothetical protein A2Y07_09370 [Planctomycetes bacterium GWF2_50_10]